MAAASLSGAHATADPPVGGAAPRAAWRVGVRQFVSLLRTRWLLKVRKRTRSCQRVALHNQRRIDKTRHACASPAQRRGWRQTLAEFVTPTLLLCALVVGARLAEVLASQEVRATTWARVAFRALLLSLAPASLRTQEMFSNKPPLSTVVGDPRYDALNEYMSLHTVGACATAKLFVAGVRPRLAASLNWNLTQARVDSAAEAAATARTLAAFDLTPASLAVAQATLSAVAAAPDPFGAVAGFLGYDGVISSKLDDAILAVRASPLNASRWSSLADEALAALLDTGSASDNASNASTTPLFSVADILAYNGPLPIPSFDEYVAIHQVIRGVFERYEPAWRAYRSIKDQTGINPLGNFLELGGVAFVPDTPAVRLLASTLAQRNAAFSSYYQGAHADVDTARQAAAAGNDVVGPWAVIVFDELTPGAVRYTIRMRFTLVPGTDEIASRYYRGLSTSYLKYYTSGFLTLQRLIEDTALAGVPGLFAVNGTAASVGAGRLVWGTPFPVAAFVHSSFFESSGPLLGMVMCLSTVDPFGMLIKGIVEEKEIGLRELLRISGLCSWALGAAWSLAYICLFLLISFVAAGVLQQSVFVHCSVTVLFGMLFLFMLSCIPLAFLVASFFSRARLASIFGPFALFALLLPRYIFFRTSQGQALGGKRVACLLAPSAFTFAADNLSRAESANTGVTAENVWDGALSVGECMAWLFFDTLLYSALAWILDQGLPDAMRSLPLAWRPWSSLTAQPLHTPRDVEAGAAASDIEPLQTSAPVVVAMRRLCKIFVRGSRAVRAVDRLDLELVDGEIVVLLGHNGAGKSTAISMLSGVLRPTSGSVTVCGVDVSRNRAATRGLVGVCPQQNVLYGSLTVLEHLRLFAVLKGVDASTVDAAAAQLLDEVGLEDKAHALAFALSGGMKRRLQLACALVGGSRVILLDEPSSGMDVISRRQIWDLLRRVRVGRTICLTTHFLDEADLLADRVAVMSEGKLRAYGSPLFLKRRLGGGLTLSVTSAAPGNAFESSLRELVAAHAPDATLLRAAGGELAWQIAPSDRGFTALLGALEHERDALGIGGFGISSATLEECFLRLAGEAPATLDAAAFTSSLSPGASVEMTTYGEAPGGALHERAVASCLPSLSPRGAALLTERSDSAHAELDPGVYKPVETRPITAFRRSFIEMMRKRALIARRDYKSVLSQVALPTLAVALVLLILKLDIDPTGPRILLSAHELAALDTRNVSQQTPVWYPDGAAVPGGPADSWIRGFQQPPFRFVPVSGADAYNGTAMSHSLLRFQRPDPPFRFGAYIPGDVVVPRFSPALCFAPLQPADGAQTALSLLRVLLNGTAPSELQLNLTALIGASALVAAQELAQPATNVLHNTSSSHALPIFTTEMRASQLRQLGGPELSAASHPLPLTQEETTTLATFLRILAAFFVLIPYSYLPATYAAFVVRERAVGAKLQLFASGCQPVAYWLAAFLSEMLNHMLVVFLCMILFAAFGVDVLVGTADKAGAIFLLLTLYGTAATPLSFCISFLFDSHAAAQVAIATFGFVTGFCLTISSFIMSVTPDTVELNKRLVVLFRIFPGFLLGEGLINLATASFDFSSISEVAGAGAGNGNSTYTAAAGAAPRNSFGNVSLAKPPNAFEWNLLGRTLLLLVTETAFFSALTLLIELHGRRIAAVLQSAADVVSFARWAKPHAAAFTQAKHVQDPGVEAERERLQNHQPCGDAVELRGLRKEYPPRGAAPAKVAVNDLWLGVQTGTRLALLGENGAGKTTTVSMLCCDIAPTSGEALVGGHPVTGAPAAVQRRIGYCPQRDPLLDLLTVREHLLLYGRLKGLPEHQVGAAAAAIWRRVGLGPFADRLAGTLSGGNKRKLSLGIGIIGSPAVLLCDEPSSGLDPQARRNLWQVISASTSDMAVILTTHALDEAEALCQRIAIMVNGSLRCIGTSQMLKERYGEGHVLDVKAPRGKGDELVSYIAAKLPLAVLSERHAEKLRLSIPREAGLPLSLVFAALQETDAPVETWAVTQASLDAVFVTVAAAAHGDDAHRPQAADESAL